MREKAAEISASDIVEYLPKHVAELCDRESEEILPKLLEKISYSDDIRLLYGRETLTRENAAEIAAELASHSSSSDFWPDRESIALSRIDTDELAERVFRFQLTEDSLLNGVFSMKIRQGKALDSLFYLLRLAVPKTLISENEKEVSRYVRRKFLMRSFDEGSSGYVPDQYLVCGQSSDRRGIGRMILICYIAVRIGRGTKLLHAAANRFQFETVEQLLSVFDSIGYAAPSHVPDLFEAARKISRSFVIHVGGTNTGKTHDAMEALAKAPSGVYLCPLRMLAYEGRTVIESYGVPCSFATGEEKEINPKAHHVSETIGMLDYSRHYDCAVIDECQLISGEDGSLYTNAILGVAAESVHVCCAYSGLDITRRLISLCGDHYEVVEHKRASELIFEKEPYSGPRKNDAYIVFSRLGAYEVAGRLEKEGMHPSIVYGKLPYEVKMEEARKFEAGETDCLVATDAIAIGQNYNIERIVFYDIVKHINRRKVRLDSQTVKQVAGRAGRYGRFPVGYVNTVNAEFRDEIAQKLQEEDVPSRVAPLELPTFLVETDLPLSLIYKAWNSSSAGEPFVKADTSTEIFVCRLIEQGYSGISRMDEYNLASLPLDLKDKAQIYLLQNLLDAYLMDAEDETYKSLLPSARSIERIVKYRPHLRDLEKLCREMDLCSSFFYKIRREDLARYVISLKGPIPRRMAEIMAAPVPDHLPGELPEHLKEQSLRELEEQGYQMEDTSSWPVGYLFVSQSGVVLRNTGRYPSGDYSRLQGRRIPQSFGNEAAYIDYIFYKRPDRIPEYCRHEPCYRYRVRIDPAFIISEDRGFYMAERFEILDSEFLRKSASGNGAGRKRRRRRIIK